ncbi:hypothetical protein CEW88_19620 (plasmid) [Alloyangia pacifica]|uniref:Uncharacterized protein n=1 Tax=Alloyangia pacifica TaxID=311180 RepID=A0A2U8HM18_9RHOB|nr:hypothetical protein CEW88_19620 [Alloyangia pacifica]
MIWVPIALGLFKFTVLGATFVLCIRAQREGEREDEEREEARRQQLLLAESASETDLKVAE